MFYSAFPRHYSIMSEKERAKITWDLSKSLIASANPRIEKSSFNEGFSEFLCLTLSLSHPPCVLLVSTRVQGPPSVVKSQYVLTSGSPGGLIVKTPSDQVKQNQSTKY